MNVFESVKMGVSMTEATKMYGADVNRSSRALCPFHNDHHPSLFVADDHYAIYCIWCNDNAYKPLAARTVSMTLKKHADEFGLEHDNHKA